MPHAVHDAENAQQILDVELTDQRHFDSDRIAVELDFKRKAVRRGADRPRSQSMRDGRVDCRAHRVGRAVTDHVDATLGKPRYQTTAGSIVEIDDGMRQRRPFEQH